MHGGPASPAGAPAAGPLVLDLCAGTAGRPWRGFAVLTLNRALPVEWEESPDFDVHRRALRDFAPGDTLAGARRAACRGSRSGRGGRFRVR
ncbi:hypothetical protein [Streptomyces sp. NPDC004065]|uniref:hypothetical protein n=1 Tax=Streptomyces sp. NPDC004065 TaxID=3364689 RepID=UPI00384D09AC